MLAEKRFVSNTFGFSSHASGFCLIFFLIHDTKMEELERKLNDELSKCLECGEFFCQERDIQLCDNCVNKFDLNRLWALHDKGKLDALDFNENKKLREQFRIPKIKQTIITSGIRERYPDEQIKTLFDKGIAMLSHSDKEDSPNFKLRRLKDVISEEKIWIIEDAQAVTLLLPEEY